MSIASTYANPITVEIDVLESFEMNAEKIVRLVAAWSPRSERKITDLSLGLAGTVERLYNEAWSLTSVALRHTVDPQRMEAIRQDVVLGAWIEVITTVGPGVTVVHKKGK